jgi:biotin carboxyl carrier protein
MKKIQEKQSCKNGNKVKIKNDNKTKTEIDNKTKTDLTNAKKYKNMGEAKNSKSNATRILSKTSLSKKITPTKNPRNVAKPTLVKSMIRGTILNISITN